MAKYRKKPIVIDAVRLTRQVIICTLEGDMIGNPGDWLITGVNGEQYPCKDEIFQQTYEPVDHFLFWWRDKPRSRITIRESWL